MHEAFTISGENCKGRWLVSCDHASNHVPAWIGGGTLGLDAQDMQRHIAYDLGAAGLARALGEQLDSPVIESGFSRLVIDANRGAEDPTLLMRIYDGTIIAANRLAGPAELAERMDRLYLPYHAAFAELAARKPDSGPADGPVEASERAILAIHSFTPRLRGRPPRPWHVGVLYSHLDARLSRPLIERLRQEKDLCIGDNEPYAGHLPGDAIDRHALRFARHNTLIELRNDLIETPQDQAAWAARLAPILSDVLAEVLDGAAG